MALKKNKEYVAIIEFLESFETIKYKIQNFLHYQEDTQKDEFLDLIKLNNSNKYDLYMEDSFNFLKNRLNFNFLDIFKYLAEVHYTTDNGKIYLCNDTLEEYQLLSSSIDINPILCASILDYTSNLDNNSRYRFLNNNINFKFYGDLEKRIAEYSDLHIHLGGTLTFDNRLHHILKNINATKLNQEHEKLFQNIVGCNIKIEDIAFTTSILETMLITLYQLNKNFNKNDWKEIEKYYLNKKKYEKFTQRRDIQEYININMDLKNLLRLLENYENINNYIYFRKYITGFNNIRNNYGVEDFYYFDNSFDDNLLKNMFENFLNQNIDNADRYLILFLVRQMQKNSKYREIIEIYFVLRTIIKKFIVQQHNREGLGYFSLYSHSNIRRDKLEYEKIYIIKSLISKNSISNIQGRISLDKNPHEIMKSMVSYIKYFKQYKKKDDKLKFVFHLKKEEDTSINNILYSKPRWYKLRKETKSQALALNSILTEPKYRKNSTINILQAKKKYRDYVKKYIAGIDVAGKEFSTPPEVYAPIYRYFKNSIDTSGMVLKGNYPYIPPEKLKEIDFQYTYHVGEDFRDILSGLRAVYEVILFLDLKDGDRLGHALALGVNPKAFLSSRNKEIKLTKLEVLDNAIFAFYMIEKFNINFIEIKNHLKELINGLSKDIYRPLKDIKFSIDDLIDAWFLRRNCPNEIKMCKNLFRSEIFKKEKSENTNRTYKLKELLKDNKLHHFIPNFDYVREAMPDFFSFDTDKYSLLNSRYKYIKKILM